MITKKLQQCKPIQSSPFYAWIEENYYKGVTAGGTYATNCLEPLKPTPKLTRELKKTHFVKLITPFVSEALEIRKQLLVTRTPRTIGPS